MNTSVRGADRALMIFEAFETAKRQLSLRELALRCDLPVSSCHAVVGTMRQRGYLYSFGRRKELYPTSRIYGLAKTIVEHDPFLARFSEDIEALRDESQETVTVAKRQGDLLQYIFALDSESVVRYAARAGDVRPLHSTANGKALLSTLSDEELEAWLSKTELTVNTAKTIATPEALKSDIDFARKRGYFVASGEYSEDLTAIAVPVSIHNEIITISIAGPTHRVAPKLDRFAEKLLSFKRKVEAITKLDTFSEKTLTQSDHQGA